MSGSLSSFFSGSVPSAVTTPATSSSSTPAWWNDFLQTTIADAASQSQQPYQAFGGPTVAPFNSYLQQSVDTGSSLNNPATTGAITSGLPGAISTTLAGYNPNTTSEYMSPYISNVLGALGQQSAYQFSNYTMPAINDQFIGAGQFGSSRESDTIGKAEYASQQALDQADASALNQGYQQAQQNQLANLGQLNTAEATAMNTGLKAAGAGEAAGQLVQNQDQANLNSAQNQFNLQTQYPWTQLSNLDSIIRGYPISGSSGTSSTSSTLPNGSTSSPFASLVGGLSSVTTPTVGNATTGFAEGGKAKRRPRKTKHAMGGLAAISNSELRPGVKPMPGLMRFPGGLRHATASIRG